MSEQPPPPPPPDEVQFRSLIEHVAGDVYVTLSRSKEEEPATACPNCGAATSAGSRFCGGCGHDLDAHALPRYNPWKLLFLSIVANVVLAASLMVCLLREQTCPPCVRQHTQKNESGYAQSLTGDTKSDKSE